MAVAAPALASGAIYAKIQLQPALAGSIIPEDAMHERRFRRIPFAAEVHLSAGEQSWSCELLDIALRGALLATDTPLPINLGANCNLSISLTDTPLCLDFNANLVHREQNHFGFKFISGNLETMTHLRKLIELNTGDVEATRSELVTWLKD